MNDMPGKIARLIDRMAESRMPSHEHGEVSERETEDGWVELWCSGCGLVLVSEKQQWESLKAEVDRRSGTARVRHRGTKVLR